MLDADPMLSSLSSLEAIEAGFRRRRARLRVVFGVVAAFSVAGLLAVLALSLRRTPEQRFRRSTLGVALSSTLTDYQVYRTRSRPRADEARKDLLSSGVERALGPEAFGALSSALAAIAGAERSAESTDAALAPIVRALDVVDARLGEQHQPAFVSGYGVGSPGERTVWITSYYVRRRSETRGESSRLRAVWGVRLDSLNLEDLVVWKADASDWVLLSFDLVEEDFVRTLLKPVAGHERMRGLAEAADAITGEILASSRLPKKDAADIDDWLSRRNLSALQLKANGYLIDTTDRLQLPNWAARALEETHGGGPDVDTMLRMNDALGAYRDAFSSAVDLLASLQEEEFVVRVLEEPRLRDTPVPALAARNVDIPELRAFASSLLALLAHAQPCPRLALWRVARWAYDATFGAPFRRLGAIVLGAVLRELGLPDEKTWAGATPADETFAAPLRSALARPPADVQAAAGRAYQAMFGRAAPVYERAVLP
jgi:hypothetical protein